MSALLSTLKFYHTFSKKAIGFLKIIELILIRSVSINLSARWQASKKEGKFAEHEFVGVCVYGRVHVR